MALLKPIDVQSGRVPTPPPTAPTNYEKVITNLTFVLLKELYWTLGYIGHFTCGMVGG